MSKETDLEFLKRYAKEKGLKINNEETYRMSQLLSDSNMNIRIPNEIKEEVKNLAKERGVPYQRLVKSFIIEGINKIKESA